MRDGYLLPFKTPPPLSQVPISLPAGNTQEILKQVEQLKTKRAIEEVKPPYSPGYYSRLFVVPKASGAFRPVIDLSKLNTYLNIPRFHMETPASIQSALEGSRWAVTLDLADAYFHIPIHKRAQHYLRFVVQDTVWQFRALPFGLSTAPFLFTWVLRPFLSVLRQQGIRIHAYLDDWLIHNPNKQILLQHLKITMEMACKLGFQINLKKSMTDPCQTFCYLGIEFDLKQQIVRTPKDKFFNIKELVQELLHRPESPVKLWARLLGKLAFIAPLITQGRLHTRKLQQHLRMNWNFDWTKRNTLIPLSPQIQQTLHWWLQENNVRAGRTLSLPPSSGTLFTDASSEGWGAHFEEHMVSGVWTKQQTQLHINHLEMMAIIYALHNLQNILKDRTITIATDNSTALGYIRNQGGTKSPQLTALTEQFFQQVDFLNLKFHCRHIPGRNNILADQLSRQNQVIHTEWTIQTKVLEWIWVKWCRPSIDAFATRLNHKLPLYFSPVPDPCALAVDALRQEWNHQFLYMFPPFPLLPAVLRKLLKSQCTTILIVPWNPVAPWFPWLHTLSKRPGFKKLPLPPYPNLLFQPLTGEIHPQSQRLNLTACWLP